MTTPREATNHGAQYRQSSFSIPKMDCPSEENLIRMALGNAGDIRSLSFNLARRELTAVHLGAPDTVLARLQPLKLGVTLQASRLLTGDETESADHWQSTFSIPKMDCPSEENLVRMAFQDLPGMQSLSFDLSKREMTALHQGDAGALLARLQPLKLGATLLVSSPAAATASAAIPVPDDAAEARTLRILLGINGAMFVLELIIGLFAQSTGLIADSLDMFADAAVYGLSLYAVGRAASMKARAAHLAGWLQLVLALGALSEVVRRFLFGSDPESALMMGMGLVALVANVVCLVLITAKRDLGAHMKASYIFSANDVLANIGVIAAGALVAWTKSPYPDLVIGTGIALVVLSGAWCILQLK